MNDLTFIFLMAITGLLLTLLVTPIIQRYMKQIGKVGIDVHKSDRPVIAEAGGIGFMFVLLIITIIGAFYAPSKTSQYQLLISAFVLLGVIILGLYDDFKQLSALKKPIMLTLIAFPVFFLREIDGYQLANPHPVLPFIGPTRLDIVYWFLAVFVISIPSNASNMLDVMNGVMTGSGILIGITAFLSTFIIPLSQEARYTGRFLSLTLTGVLVGFYYFNRYPAKIFAGDTGSLGVGATVGLIAIYGEMEFVMVIALLVHIMNSFSILGSVKGLKERSQMARPVIVNEGIVSPSIDSSAPITLVRLIVARNPLGEKEIIRMILGLVAYTCVLAILSAFLIRDVLI